MTIEGLKRSFDLKVSFQNRPYDDYHIATLNNELFQIKIDFGCTTFQYELTTMFPVKNGLKIYFNDGVYFPNSKYYFKEDETKDLLKLLEAYGIDSIFNENLKKFYNKRNLKDLQLKAK